MPIETRPEVHPQKPEWKAALAVFAVTAAGLGLLLANRFFLSLDEGIYLTGAERILRGQAPYRDFFALTGPVSFWIQAAALGLLGRTLAHARLVMVADLAVLASAVYWLTARLTRRPFALGVTFIFVALETRPLFRLYVNHRWDSSALALLAVALCLAGIEQPAFLPFFTAGILAAAAAWATPSMLVLVAALGLWPLMKRQGRSHFLPYLLGAGLCSAGAAGVLFLQGALGPMFHDLLWTAGHYRAANRVSYGYGAIAPGGLSAIFAGARGSAILARATGLLAVLLPALLPLGVYGAWLLRRWRRRPQGSHDPRVLFLVICSVAILASTYPRWSADQLLFVAPIFYVLAGYFSDQLLRGRWLRTASFGCLLLLAAAALTYSTLNILSAPVIETQVGPIRATPADQQFINFACRAVRPGDSLFVYPYLPIVYFLTGARNPSRYSFLQPGMMSSEDYSTALADLRARPPRWIFYFPLTRELYHSVWPNADPGALQATPLDRYVREHYHPAGELKHPVGEFFILERNGS